MKLLNTLEETLRREPNYVADDGHLKKWVIISKAQNFDETLLSLLLSHPDLKTHFFLPIAGSLVFNQPLFVAFMEQKNYLNDSFTAYKNKIGLTINGRFLNQRNEVALVWPYKDCILEGGQSREEQGRDEIFFNQTLAQDEITQLLDPKVLTNARRYSPETSDGEPVTSFSRNETGQITDNLIIKGNNLLALHSLKSQFAGRVKLIYIDPPYNTGNDGFQYNDRFNHSSWLTFMRNRLEIARTLLSDDGFLFVHCDDNELGYLLVLLDDTFGRDNKRNVVLTKRYDKNLNNQFVENGLKTMNTGADYVCIYSKKNESNLYAVYRAATEERSTTGYWKGFWNSPDRPTMRYDLLGESITTGQWKWEKDKAKDAVRNYVDYLEKHSTRISLENYWQETGKTKKFLRKVAGSTGKHKGVEHWIPPSDGILRNSNWTDLMTSGVLQGFDFRNPKSEELIGELLKLATKPGDIVLDYHLGSGTTAAVAHKMGRQYIGVEQMDYIETVAVERLKKVVAGEPGGISKSVGWQGGGSFLYLELKKYNQHFMELIEAATNTDALLTVWEQMKQRSFLAYNIDLKQQDKNVDEFKTLTLRQQKEVLASLLDKNQLYVNRSAMNDADLGVTDEDKQLTTAFFGR